MIPAEKISQRRRPGVMSTGFVSLVGNKTMPLHRGAELKSVQRFAVDRRDRPPRLAFFPRPALGELPAGDFFEIGFDFEHCFLQIGSHRVDYLSTAMQCLRRQSLIQEL